MQSNDYITKEKQNSRVRMKRFLYFCDTKYIDKYLINLIITITRLITRTRKNYIQII